MRTSFNLCEDLSRGEVPFDRGAAKPRTLANGAGPEPQTALREREEDAADPARGIDSDGVFEEEDAGRRLPLRGGEEEEAVEELAGKFNSGGRRGGWHGVEFGDLGLEGAGQHAGHVTNPAFGGVGGGDGVAEEADGLDGAFEDGLDVIEGLG